MTTETIPATVPAEPTTPIKPSEAIRLGCLLAPVQGFGPEGDRSCALGAMQLGLGRAGEKTMTVAFSALSHELRGRCPQGCAPVGLSLGDDPDPLVTVVWHLNDAHRWSRERIADWLEGLGL